MVVLAASLGGLAALRRVLADLPADLPAAVLVVLHRQATAPNVLATILRRHSTLPVFDAIAGGTPWACQVHVAPPDMHLCIGPTGLFAVDGSGPICFVSSAVDPLLESAARIFRERLLAVILTGRGRDGAAGTIAVAAAGGTILAENPATARAAGMPTAALATGFVRTIHDQACLGSVIAGLVSP